MTATDYWMECVAEAAEECGLDMTPEQLAHIAATVKGSHENYGSAFYSPPASDRLAVMNREHELKLKSLQAEFDRYRSGAESAVRKALRTNHDAHISITERGEVYQHGGRTTQLI